MSKTISETLPLNKGGLDRTEIFWRKFYQWFRDQRHQLRGRYSPDWTTVQSFTSCIHRGLWTEPICNSSRITGISEHFWNKPKVVTKVQKKNLCVCRIICEQIFSHVTHHIEVWTSRPVNYGRHASQGVNDRSKWYSSPVLTMPQNRARKSLCNLRTLQPCRVGFMRQQQFLSIFLRGTVYV